MCDVKKCTEDLLSLGQCCLDKVSNEWAVLAWNFRAEFWTKDYTERPSECSLQLEDREVPVPTTPLASVY